MNCKEAIAYIENQGWSKTRLGLDRSAELLKKLGDPQKGLKFVHVAGSNGKGSTCAMLDIIFRKAGYHTGLYISPYIQDFCERIQIDGKNIPGEDLARITEIVKAEAEAMEDHPSQFEIVTAVAMMYFKEQKCDIVVLEVGMGGAYDATNTIDAPELACITNIGLEHTEYLGDTLEKIAETKSGIIKTGCSCVCYDGAPEVTEVVRKVCSEKNVPLACVDYSNMKCLSSSLEGQRIEWRGKEYDLKLIGNHQLHNAALVLTGVELLRQRGWNLSEDAVKRGLAEVTWPARLELLGKKPYFILDGGHNPQCAEAMTDSIRTLFPGRKFVFLTGILADKDYNTVLDMMTPLASEFVCLTPLSDRALPATELEKVLQAKGAKAQCPEIVEAAAKGEADPNEFECIEAGIRLALDRAGKDGCVIAFGSLYLAGAVRTVFTEKFEK